MLMDRNELIERLKGYEWNDVEFKKAQHDVPESAYETVAAFANTAGGWLIFGIKDHKVRFEVVGVLEVDKVQNDFLSTLRSKNKLNRVVNARAQILKIEEKTVLVFYIPEVRREEKPVYLKGDIRKSYLRRGGGDERCTQEEIERLLRDASDVRYDAQFIKDLDPEHCFDPDSVKWYRILFNQKNPGRYETLSDIEFLNEWGFVRESGDKLVPTRSAILLFGRDSALRQIMPRPVVDYQWILYDYENWSPENRWQDRLVIEENLVKAWRLLVDRYLKHAERPFSLDAATLRRVDDPPDYISFREAAINLLIHQDFADYTRKPVIKFFRDRTVFWNPGDAFASGEELLEPTEKEVRNPAIVAAFRRIGLSDQAGTGIRAIFHNWQKQGYIPPVIDNNRTRKTFELTLFKEMLLSPEQLLFQKTLGIQLNSHEAKSFAYACRKGSLGTADVKAVTGLKGPDAIIVLKRLADQLLLEPVENSYNLYQLADQLRGRLYQVVKGNQTEIMKNELTTAEITPTLKLNDTQEKIITLCESPRSMSEIMESVGMSHRSFFKRKHIDPLIKNGILQMTNPDNPKAANQKYVLSDMGVQLKLHKKESPDKIRDNLSR
jgi:ATP-dependent DNA helicase RecG